MMEEAASRSRNSGRGGRGRAVFNAFLAGLLAAVVPQRCLATETYGSDEHHGRSKKPFLEGKMPSRLAEHPASSSRGRHDTVEAVYGEHLDQLDAEENGVDHSCPYLIETEEEALRRQADTSLKGNVVTIEHWKFCRTGNHFSSMFRNLALGYCCKSRLMWLPPKDDVLAPGVFSEGTPGPRWFDFSDAPDVQGFDSDSCTTDITWAGPRAFRLEGVNTPDHEFYTPGLKECIKKVPRLLGCEAAYFFPTDIDVCPPREEVERDGEEGGEEEGAGNLVIHVRSGDIFDNAVLPYYGQPPLQFYLQVMRHKRWSNIDIVTWAEHVESMNPVVPVMQQMQIDGELPDNLNIHTNRSIAEDLRTMMCADALATARSTIICLTTFHTTATTVYEASECNDKLRALSVARPGIEVFGMDWPRWQYSVYMKWENTDEQRDEMINYNNVNGLPPCQAH